MEYIIGEGSDRDPKALRLSALDGSHIPNVRRPEDPPEVRRSAIEMFKSDHPDAKLRSSSSVYNCVGHVFAGRRTHVSSDHLPMILEKDGYYKVSDLQRLWVGDIVVYENAEGEATHVGQVVEIQSSVQDGGRKVMILSKWGTYGEYLHEISDVPSMLGAPKTYWSERREVQ
jgi:hypothetical protein